MKTFIAALVSASAFVLGGCSSAVSDSGGFTDLFKPDLSDAVYEKGVWSFDKNGVLKSNKDQIIFTKGDYENFEIELEYKLEKGSNSGIVVYCTDAKDWIPNSMEIQIADNTDPRYANRPITHNGAIFGHVFPEYDTTVPLGVWSKMRVVCKGKNIDVWIDGKHASKIDLSQWTDNKKGPNGVDIPAWPTKHKKSEITTKGKIGLQGLHGTASTEFRNIKIRPLSK